MGDNRRPDLRDPTEMKRITLAAALLAALAAQAQTTVKDAWIRGTVAQQKATGMFAQITSGTGGRLVSAASPVAGVVTPRADGPASWRRAWAASLHWPSSGPPATGC